MSTLARRAAARWPVLSGMREAIGMGLSALVAYKMRAGLTILGVVMGIMTVTGMSSIVAGLNRNMASQIDAFGASVIFLRPFGEVFDDICQEFQLFDQVRIIRRVNLGE